MESEVRLVGTGEAGGSLGAVVKCSNNTSSVFLGVYEEGNTGGGVGHSSVRSHDESGMLEDRAVRGWWFNREQAVEIAEAILKEVAASQDMERERREQATVD